jgi:YggT family protein
MGLIAILVLFLRLYEMLIFMRIILSWVPIDRDNVLIDYLLKITDPVLMPVREIYMRLMDRLNIHLPIDLSPIIVFILIGFLERSLVSIY